MLIGTGPFAEVFSRQMACSHLARFKTLLFPYFENREEGLLRDVDFADPLHALLAFLLLFEELAFAADVPTVTFGNDVFADRGDCLASDDLTADCGLNGYLEHLARNELAHLGNESLAAVIGEVTMHDD